MSDIQLDTPLGNGMAEILSWAKEARRCAGRRHEVEVSETIIALCDALEEAHAKIELQREVIDAGKRASLEVCQHLREAREENERLEELRKAEEHRAEEAEKRVGYAELEDRIIAMDDHIERLRDALEKAVAAVWDGHYSGEGVSTEYAQAIDREAKEALRSGGEEKT